MNANKAGHRIRVARTMARPRLTQDDLVVKMQVAGFKITKNILSRIETNRRYVTDLELVGFAKVLKVSTSWLLEESDIP